MRTTTDIIYNVTGQTFAYTVPQGAASSATFSVFNDTDTDDATAEFSGTATMDSVSTAVSSASGMSQADPQKISLTTTGIVLTQKYLISEASFKEWVQPIEIQSGYIRVRYPLKNNYTTAATFKGATITGAVNAAWVAGISNINDAIDQNPGYRVRWAIVVSGVTCIAYSYLRLVRAAVTHNVDVDDIAPRAPGWYDGMPTDFVEEQGRPLIDSAWRSVQAKLASMDIGTDAMRDDSIVDELVILRTLSMIAMGGWKPRGYQSVADYVKDTDDAYNRFLEQHFQSAIHHRLSSDNSGAAAIRFAQPHWAK